jgi:hypothetical protein
MSAEILKPFGDYKTPDANDAVIKALEDLVAKAKAGEIQSFACAYVMSNDWTAYRNENGTSGLARLLGAVTVMQHAICNSWAAEP